MASNLFNGTTDLGPTGEMMAAFAHFGKLSPDLTYGNLHGALHAVLSGAEGIDDGDLRKCADEARAFARQFEPDLSDHELWILSQLIKAPDEANGNGSRSDQP